MKKKDVLFQEIYMLYIFTVFSACKDFFISKSIATSLVSVFITESR